jgi:hypothetical protein
MGAQCRKLSLHIVWQPLIIVVKERNVGRINLLEARIPSSACGVACDARVSDA